MQIQCHFIIKDLSIHRFWYKQGSWNQFSLDTEGWLYYNSPLEHAGNTHPPVSKTVFFEEGKVGTIQEQNRKKAS